jgi:hypothetical protein
MAYSNDLNIQKCIYDPSNKKHREEYFKMADSERYSGLNSWRLEPGYSSVFDMMQEKTIQYYLYKEFGKKSQRKNVIYDAPFGLERIG